MNTLLRHCTSMAFIQRPFHSPLLTAFWIFLTFSTDASSHVFLLSRQSTNVHMSFDLRVRCYLRSFFYLSAFKIVSYCLIDYINESASFRAFWLQFLISYNIQEHQDPLLESFSWIDESRVRDTKTRKTRTTNLLRCFFS